MTKGIYTHAFDPAGDPGVILRASGGATIAGPELTREGQTADTEEALRLGVDAMATTAFVGSVYEHETLIGMARMATECRKWDMPLLGVIGLGKTVITSYSIHYTKLYEYGCGFPHPPINIKINPRYDI